MAVQPHVVSIVRYRSPRKSVREAVSLSTGLDRLKPGDRVFIKPNIVFWTRAVPFPKWGVITTSRVVQDMVELLKDLGAGPITIGEGGVMLDPRDSATPAAAFDALGYGLLQRRYGVAAVNVHARPFEPVDLGDGVVLNFNRDILESDFVVNLPVLKTHAQTVVSLGIKNLKGTIDIPSRKRCHSAEPGRDLNYMIARLADRMPPMFTLLDGIFTSERGPSFEGRLRRTNLLVASADVLSADLVGARLLGYSPAEVPHLAHAAGNHGRPLDLSDIRLTGEDLAAATVPHAFSFPYNENGTLPAAMAQMGISGLSYRKYDLTMCTYCSAVNGAVLTAIAKAWKGRPWDEVEILTGKTMAPTPGKKKTILLGKCIYQAHKNNPDIQEMIPVKGCPPRPADICKALRRAGIAVDPAFFENFEQYPGAFMARYRGNPDFTDDFFQVS